MKDFLTTGQCAKIANVAPRTITKWYAAGRFDGYQLPGSNDRRISRESFAKFLQDSGMPLGDLEEKHDPILLLTSDDAFRKAFFAAVSDTAAEHLIVVCKTGFDCGVECERHHPRVVVLDFSTGCADCELILRTIRRGHPDTQVVAIACEDEPDETRLWNVGAAVAFKRPCDPAAVADAAVKLLSEKAAK